MTPDDKTSTGQLADAFDAEAFRRQGHALVDCLADYLGAAQGRAMPVLPWVEPDAMLAQWSDTFPEEGGADLLEMLQLVIAEANHLHHPRYVGHQVAAPLPAAALCDLAASVLNNGMAVYEHGMSGTAMELRVVKWMARALGMGDDADGCLTSGGSVGNLTALLAARETAAKRGLLADDARPALLGSAAAHYSLARAVKAMGWGEDGIVTVPHDASQRLCADALEDALQRAEDDGRRVIGVIGNACCTPTGCYDPLESIADFCAEYGLWFHADGAHGAAACLSTKYRHLVAGIERADSVVWDAHKMVMMPTLCTAVLFREGAHAYAAFAQEASYLYSRDPQEEWYNLGHRTIECTKRMLALKLYAALQCHGTAVFGEHVTRRFDLAREFAAMLRAAPDFELAAEPESNILCFRYIASGETDLDSLQATIRKRMLEQGEFYLVQTRLDTGLFLRTALMNPFTSMDDLAALLDAIRDAAA